MLGMWRKYQDEILSMKREDPISLHSLEGTTIVEDMARETPRIYLMLEGW